MFSKSFLLYRSSAIFQYLANTYENTQKIPIVKTTIAKIAITQGNPGLPWVLLRVEPTIDYFVGFSLIVLGFKTHGRYNLGYPD